MSNPTRYDFAGYGVECEHDKGKYCLYTYCEALERDKQELHEACRQKQEIIDSNKELLEDYKALEQELAEANGARQTLSDANDVMSCNLLDVAKQNERYKTAIQKYLDGDYPHPTYYRPEQCPHEKYYYEECGECDDEYFQGVLAEALKAASDGT